MEALRKAVSGFCLFQSVNFLLKTIEEKLNMPAVRGGMMTGQGKRQQFTLSLCTDLTGFDGRKVVRLVFIGVDGKVPETDPGQGGNGIGVFRRGSGLA
jgi:hypothetical protein